MEQLGVEGDVADRQVLDALRHYAVIRLDRVGRIAVWYRGAQRLTGYPAEEALGRPVMFLYDSHADPDLADRELAIADREGHYATEGWRFRRDGSRFWADVTISPIRDNTGERVGFVKVLRDCTGRHEQDLTFMAVEALLNSITEFEIIQLDREGLIRSWNPGAQRLTQYNSQEVLGRHVSMFYTDDDIAAGLANREMAMAANEDRFETEGWRVRKDGSRFWADIVLSPIHDDSKKIVGYVKVARDVTGPQGQR